mmetsp:Transcript_38666/g.92508  ORF Transcript_38666/g.92508 Transcript_38666/m.92508 type:complete len:367 (+) Transcript_38666:573-1673(+)
MRDDEDRRPGPPVDADRRRGRFGADVPSGRGGGLRLDQGPGRQEDDHGLSRQGVHTGLLGGRAGRPGQARGRRARYEGDGVVKDSGGGEGREGEGTRLPEEARRRHPPGLVAQAAAKGRRRHPGALQPRGRRGAQGRSSRGHGGVARPRVLQGHPRRRRQTAAGRGDVPPGTLLEGPEDIPALLDGAVCLLGRVGVAGHRGPRAGTCQRPHRAPRRRVREQLLLPRRPRRRRRVLVGPGEAPRGGHSAPDHALARPPRPDPGLRLLRRPSGRAPHPRLRGGGERPSNVAARAEPPQAVGLRRPRGTGGHRPPDTVSGHRKDIRLLRRQLGPVLRLDELREELVRPGRRVDGAARGGDGRWEAEGAG